MSKQRKSTINNLGQKVSSKGGFRPWAGILMGCLLLAACQSSNIKSSKTHFLRPTDPPAYLNNGMGNPNIDSLSQNDANSENDKPEEVYTITVTEMSVRDLLFALARDAGVNIDVYPGIDGRVTLSAVDQTLPQILDRIANQVAIRYEISDETIIISPDLPFLKIYEIDYINIVRSSKSSNKVSTRLSSDNASDPGELSQSNDSNLSTSNLDTATTNQFWQSLSSNIETILNPNDGGDSQSPLSSPIESEGDDLLDLEADNLSPDSLAGESRSSGSKNKAGIMALNSEAGQISIYASAAQHERIKQLVDSIMGSVHRQVMIESTVVEVELSDQFQEGVDWDIMFNGAVDIGLKGIFSQGELFTLGRDPTPTVTSSTTSKKAIRAAIKVLETFGNTKVLSSPKIMALNNQPALLKVVKNKVFFTLESNTTKTTTGTNDEIFSTPVFDTKIHTVPVGLIMNVTPHIAKDGIVTLNVRPTITRITSSATDPNPALKANTLTTGITTDIVNSIPEIEVKEMETMMRVHSGQVAVMGGLMQDEIVNEDNGIPGLGRVPGLGILFSHKNRTVKKTELVIFLRPVIIGHNQPKTRQQRARQINPGGHIAQDARGTNRHQQIATSQKPNQEDVAPGSEPTTPASVTAMAPQQPAAVAMAPAPGIPGSYLDFTSPQGMNGAQYTPSPSRMAAQSQAYMSKPAGIAPPPARAPGSRRQQSAYQQAAYPTPQGSYPIQQANYPAQQANYPAQQTNYPAQQTAQQAAYPAQQRAQYQARPLTYGANQQSGFFVDLGSYLEQTHANDVQRKINAIGLPIQQESALVQGQTYQRVRSGPFPNQEVATQAMVKITNYTGIQARIARF
jgi:MSHA biogenesis protein MshL